jgi:DNA polymerase I-like protein with 3'-5' exonuclease and polymerase domains
MGYSTIRSRADLEILSRNLDDLPADTVVAFDVEATGLAMVSDAIVGFALSWSEGNAVYVPTYVADAELLASLGYDFPAVAELILRKLKRFRLVAHKWVYDATLTFTNFGVALPCWDDTLLLAKLNCLPLGLKDIMVQIFHLSQEQVKEFKELMVHHFGVQFKHKGHTTAELPLGQGEWDIDRYCCQDADYCLRFYYYAKPYLKKNGVHALHKVEVNLLPLVRRLNLTGAPLNPADMEVAVVQVRTALDQTEQAIYAARPAPNTGVPFKINSPRECPQVLFQELGLPVILRSDKTGTPSTKKEVLDQLEDMHPIVPLIRDWRDDSRMVKSYLDKLPQQARQDPQSRVYTEFNSLGAISGRFTSSSNEDAEGMDHGTNLQNVSKKLYNWVQEVEAEDGLAAELGLDPEKTYTEAELESLGLRLEHGRVLRV